MATRFVLAALGGLVVLVVLAYHVLRLMAEQCTGPGCDWYIPFSLFLPIIAILLAGLTGAFAAYGERDRRGWSVVIGICAILAVFGPILAAFALSDNDTKVWVATGFLLTVPATVWLSALTRRTSID